MTFQVENVAEQLKDSRRVCVFDYNKFSCRLIDRTKPVKRQKSLTWYHRPSVGASSVQWLQLLSMSLSISNAWNLRMKITSIPIRTSHVRSFWQARFPYLELTLFLAIVYCLLGQQRTVRRLSCSKPIGQSRRD